MDLTKRVNDAIIEYRQDRGSTPLQSNFLKKVFWTMKNISQVRRQVSDQVFDQVRRQVWIQVRDQVMDQVLDQVWIQVRDQVRDQVNEKN